MVELADFSEVWPAGRGRALAGAPRPAGASYGDDPTLYHVLLIGQSNADAADASPVVSPTPVCRGGAGFPGLWMLNQGVRVGGTTTAGQNAASGTATAISERQHSALVPLFEQADSTPHGETCAWGLSYRLARYGVSTIVSCSSGDGLRYNQMNKGSLYYANTLDAVRAGQQLARRWSRPYRVLCLVALHGEADQAFGITGYDANLATWRSDYDRDIKAITGQGEDVLLFGDQQHSQAPNAAGVFAAGTGTALGWWLAHKTDPARVIPVAPRYARSYRQSDGSSIHMSQHAQRQHGEAIGQAIYRRMFRNEQWRPVAPIPGSLHRSGTLVTGDFYCPTPPLQLAYDHVGRVSSPLLGFTYYDDSGTPPTVTAVSQTGPVSFQWTLSGTPTGTPASEALRGAFGSTAGANCGPFRGDVRTNLCDSEREPAYDGTPLRNWCLIFHEAVT